jgi:hypothetical protein
VADAQAMEPEHLSPEAIKLIKFHLASMTAAITAAKDTANPAEAERHWSEYHRHQAEVDRLLSPDYRSAKRPW